MDLFFKSVNFQWLFVYVCLNFLNFGTSLNYESVKCTSTSKKQTHLVPENTIIHFFTPNTAENWLTSFWSHSDQNCNEKFLTTKNNSKLWIAVFNGDGLLIFSNGKRYYYYENDYYFSNSNSLEFMAGKAVEGVIFSYDPTTDENSCPFSNSVIKMKEEMIIPITSSSFDITKKPKKCSWQFSINHETQKLKVFKVAIQRYKLIDEKYPKCIEQISSKIIGANEILTFQNTDDNGCTVLVSVVKKYPQLHTTKCKHKIINDSVIHVFNSDNGIGYGPYEKCEYVINVPKNHVVLLRENYLILEDVNDILVLEETSGKQRNASGKIFLNENANGTILKFQSDGNIQKLGFNFTIETIKKQCSESEVIIPCDPKKRKAFTPFVVPEAWYFYKGMQCNFTLKMEEGCNAYSYSIQIYGQSISAIEDGISTLELYANGKLIKNIATKKMIQLPMFSGWSINFQEQFLSSQIITLKLAVPESVKNYYPSGAFSFWASSNGPLITSPIIYLNNTFNAYTVELNTVQTNNLLTVCAQDAKDELEIYFAATVKYDGDGFDLYDSTGISNKSMKLNESMNQVSDDLRYQKSSSGCFTLHRYSIIQIEGKVLLKLKPAKSTKDGCNNFHNVFVLSLFYHRIELYNNATETCEIFFIYLSGQKTINLLNFATSQNSSFIVQTVQEKNELFKISSEDAFLWNNVQFSTQFLSIQMSPMSKLSYTVENRWHLVDVIDEPTKSLFYANHNTNMNPQVILNAKHEFNITFSYKIGNASCPWKITAISKRNTSTFVLNLNSQGSGIGYQFYIENSCNDEMHPNIYIEYFAQEIPSTKELSNTTLKNLGQNMNDTSNIHDDTVYALK